MALWICEKVLWWEAVLGRSVAAGRLHTGRSGSMIRFDNGCRDWCVLNVTES